MNREYIMNTSRMLFAMLIAALAVPLAATPLLAFAQGADPAALEAPTIWQELIPLAITAAVPILIYFGKQLIPILPKWLLPVLAPALGMVLTLVVDAGAGGDIGIVMGAVYGGLGTWLREMIKQLNGALAGGGA
ncbi:MAG: hypothetical protein CL946_06635 [Ectothiorhodospiraceae bacterium]|nr:hypothetical protein [Ectothiorhodospiraceae bacterium]